MNLKERIQDIFDQYSVHLESEEKDEKEMKHTPEHKDEKTEMAKKTLANGTTIYTDADAFAVGVDVFIVNEEGERMPLPDGEYEYEEGGKTVVADGKIAEMVEAEDEKDEKEMEHTPDHKDEKEEMSYTLTESELSSMIAKAVGAAKEEFAKDMEATKDELSSMKEMLSSQRAEGGLSQSKTNAKRMTFSDLKGLDAKDRVAAIHEIYSNQ